MNRLEAAEQAAADRTATPEPKITREMVERYFAAKKGRALSPFLTLRGMNVTPCYVVHEHDLDALCTLALQAEAMQPRPIEELPKEGKSIMIWPTKVQRWIYASHYDEYSIGEGWRRSEVTAWLPLSSLPEPRR